MLILFCCCILSVQPELHSYLILHVLCVHQALLQEDQQGGLAGLPDLVVGVGEEGDHQGQEVAGHSLVEVLWVLVAIHGYVRHLFHQFGPDTRLWKMNEINTQRQTGPDFWNLGSHRRGQRLYLYSFKTVGFVCRDYLSLH